MKKRLNALFATGYFVFSSLLQAAPIDASNINYLGPIAPDNALKPFETDRKNAILNNLKKSLEADTDTVTFFGEQLKWQGLDKLNALTEPGLQALKFTITAPRFTAAELTLKGIEQANLYLNSNQLSSADNTYKLALTPGQHQIIIVVERVDDWKKIELDLSSKLAEADLVVAKQAPTRLSAKQLFDSETVSNLALSPNGKHLVWQTTHYNDKNANKAIRNVKVVTVKTNRTLFSLPNTATNFAWSKDSKNLVYTNNNTLYSLAIESLNTRVLSEDLKGISNLQFFDNNSLLFTWLKQPQASKSLTKYYYGLEDRWSYARNKTSAYLYDLQSGLMRQVSPAQYSVSLQDFDAKRNTLLLSRTLSDYGKPSHMKTVLFEYALADNKVREIGQYHTFSRAQYASNGLYISAGPEFSGNTGKAVADNVLSNNYDTQLYFVNYKGDEVKPLSKNFSPNIGAFTVLNNDDLIINVGQEDTRQLYLFDKSKSSYKNITTQLDIIERFSVSDGRNPTLVYTGTSALKPQQVRLKTKLLNNKSRTLWDSQTQFYTDTALPSLEEFNFTNEQGVEIKGRVYLPSSLDKTKKYPALIYYYGGTSPVSRAFTGRYPFNLWAENGYVVYVLQPTGATGFGQDFSAKHVNAWGDHTADEIIAGTKAFIDKYPFVDKTKLGNLGASYGGFMTMLLATKTDMFSASISHAGISDITSYWGQGWWGYLYSAEASKNSYPWNNSELYSQHSPVFNADKVTTPLLLIHGDSDTNVPVGESHTMYTALKLLNQDVELVEYKGADHQIFARDRRFHWWNTMLAYFDKHLKDEPQWWQSMYPSK